MAFILKASSSFPKYKYTQNQINDLLATIWPKKSRLIMQLGKNVLVEERALCLPVEEVVKLGSFAERNKLWQQAASNLAEQSILGVMEASGLRLNEVDLFITTSVTGISIPSIDTVLMDKMDFNPGTKRLPLFGFGCLGGVASLNRAFDFLAANPTKTALVTAVELCSLTFQLQDCNIPNLVGSSLFGDGAASVLLVGRQHPLAQEGKIKIEDYKAFFYKGTADTMGWNILDSGFQLILDNTVSDVVEANIPENVKYLLDQCQVNRQAIKFTVSHPGGPKVLLSMQEALGVSKEYFKHSWESLAAHGNISSVSVLNVLERELATPTSTVDEQGLMLAMGPGFNSEITLIKRVR